MGGTEETPVWPEELDFGPDGRRDGAEAELRSINKSCGETQSSGEAGFGVRSSIVSFVALGLGRVAWGQGAVPRSGPVPIKPGRGSWVLKPL